LRLSVAIILTLPNRELAAISTFDLPKTKQTGAFKIDAFVYLDRKNKPSDKTGLVASGDINIQKQAGSLNGEIKFIYPSQSKVRYSNSSSSREKQSSKSASREYSEHRRNHVVRSEGNLTKKAFSILLSISAQMRSKFLR
jgi:hypothetical protein